MAWDRARTLKWLGLSVGITVGVTLLLWHLVGTRAFFGFLFLPFLPILFRGGGREEVERRTCPRCGHVAYDPDDRYCPRDGSALV